MTGYRAAVDFGTSYTAAASQSGPQSAPVVVPLVDEGRLSSAVAVDDSGSLQAGPLVEQVAALAPDRVERTPKRCLDQPDVMLGREPVQTVDLVAAVLGYVREELHRHFNGSDPDELCLTHPARWEAGDPRMRRLEAAAGQAGFGSVRLLPEPCAAALALAAEGQLDGVGEGELIAVYDLGGGTFDTALLSRAPGGDFVLVGEPGGDPELGGEWLDDRLFERLSGQLPADDETCLRDPGSSPDPLRWRRAGFAFRQGIRRAKERLARETSVQIALNPPFSLDHLSLSRAELERTATPLITKSADRFDLFLQRNSKVPADLAAICLVGGSSRLTVVNRILGNRFDRPVANHGDPKSVTALGALCEIPASAPGPKITSSLRRPRVSVGAEAAPAGSPGRDQGSTADVLDVPAAGRPSPSPRPSPGQPLPQPAVAVAEDTRPAGTPPAGPGQGPRSPGSGRPAPPAGAAPPGAAAGDGTAAPGAAAEGRKKSHKTAWIVGGAVVLCAAAVVVFIILTMNPILPLNQFMPPHKNCQTEPQHLYGEDYAGATSILKCTSAGLPVYALRFDNNADYSAGLAKANYSTGWDADRARAGNNACPLSAAAGIGMNLWTSQQFSAERQGQFEECYYDQAGNPWFLMTWPSQRTFYTGQASPVNIPAY
jgi:hypothetical protein